MKQTLLEYDSVNQPSRKIFTLLLLGYPGSCNFQTTYIFYSFVMQKMRARLCLLTDPPMKHELTVGGVLAPDKASSYFFVSFTYSMISDRGGRS